MSAAYTSTSLSAETGTVLTGVPVVPGVRFAPVIRPGRLPDLDELDPGGEVPEADRDAEAARFSAASSAVAERLRARAASSTGSASEVLAATATLAQDRAWLGAAEKRIKEGMPAVRATAEAVAQFVDLFTQIGGLMAERVTDLRDIRDRVIAELSGLAEPGVPVPRRRRFCALKTSRPPTPPGWTRRWSSAWPPPWAGRPATPRSSPASWGFPASSR